MNKPLSDFMRSLTWEQQERFAALAGTSVGGIRHLVTERRFASSEMAIALEKAAGRLRVSNLPPLNRRDLSRTCKTCEYAKKCTKKYDTVSKEKEHE